MRLIEFTQRLFESLPDGGDCYESAANIVLDERHYTLVHGVVTGQGPLAGVRFGHAWVEHEGNVIDKSNGRELEFPRELYYAIGNVDPSEQHRYTYKEIREMIQEHGTWGPWEAGVSPEVE